MKRTILLLAMPLMFISAWSAEDKSLNAETDIEETSWVIDKERNNVMEIRVNAAGFLWGKTRDYSRYIELKELNDLTQQFVKSQPKEHIIAIVTNDNYGAIPQSTIDKVKQELQEAYQTIRNEEARKKYMKAYKTLKYDQKRDICKLYPYKVIEIQNVYLNTIPLAPPPQAESLEYPEILEVVDSVDTVEFPSEELLSPEEEKKLKVYDVPEVAAEFPSDIFAWINKNIRYPQDCVKDGVSGRVVIQFIVDRDGAITDAEVLRSPDSRLSAEALRIVESMPKWEPAREKGHSVRMRYILPVRFKLPAPEIAEYRMELKQGDLFDRIGEVTIKAIAPVQKKRPVDHADTIMHRNVFILENGKKVDIGTCAEFPGDVYAWLIKNMKYPPICQEMEVQGQVLADFFIEKDGTIGEVQVFSSPDIHLTKEVVRVVKAMPKWKPAQLQGQPTRMRYTLPINFKMVSPPIE